jgi:putative DNA primase/helicase
MSRPQSAAVLRPKDIERLHQFRMTDELIELHELRRVTDREAREECGIRYSQSSDLSGTAWPIWGADGAIKGYRIRRDNPEIENGKPKAKYIQSLDRARLYFELSSRRWLSDTSVPVIFVEAYSSALAIAAWCQRIEQRYLIIATAGCWGWRGTIGKSENEHGGRVDEKGPSPDLVHIAFEKREVFILFDSNAATNDKVKRAIRAFSKELQSRKAIVRLPALPEVDGVNGPDDYLSKFCDEDLTKLLKDAKTADNDEEFLQMLAKLPRLEYDRQRQAAAAKFGIRVPTLDVEVEKLRPKENGANRGQASLILSDPEPWPEAVDGTTLLDALLTLIERYVILPAGAAVTIVLWIVHTYLLDAADVTPILAITSPEKRCGKTVVLELQQLLVCRALPSANITAAALFRTIEAYAPTLLIDEADTFLPDNDEVRGVINSGHRRPNAFVLRCVGDEHTPTRFSTWCPKAIALIGKLPGTLADRSINIPMRRKMRAETVARLRYRTVEAETADLRRKLARWAQDHSETLASADPDVPDALNDRAQDCWRPLLAIADEVGGSWSKEARKATLALLKKHEEEGTMEQLLGDIHRIFGKADKLFSETIVAELGKMEVRPWPEWSKGKPITKSQLARQLSKFEIVPGTIRIDGQTNKGYYLKQFFDAFSRYGGFQNVTTTQPTPDVDCDGFQNVTPDLNVTARKTSQPAPVLDCDDVTFSNGGIGEEKQEAAEEERL